MPVPPARLALLALVLLLPWALLWPLPLVFGSALLTSPLSEGVTHLWGWWAALREGAPFTVRTDLLNHPVGLEFQLIDPLHLVPYALFAWWSPAAGFNAVLVWGVMVGALGGLLLARETGAGEGGQALGACVGASAPTTLAVAVDGITEGLGVGWVAVQLALLLSLRRGVSAGRLLGLGAALAAATLSGPYNAIWCAIIDVPVGLWLLRRTRAHLLAAAGAGLVCLPYLLAVSQRDPNLPGGAERAGLGTPRVVQPWRAAGERGVDLLDLFVPAPLTGPHADLPHTAYLGVVTLALALGAALLGWRARRRGLAAPASWPWLLGAVVFAALALGPWITVAGEYPTVGGRPLVGPAGLLALTTPLGRLSRWYRAGAVAVLLLVPLAARLARGRSAAALCALVLLDARLLAPLPAAFPTLEDRPSAALARATGPIAELPPIHPMFFAGMPADLNLLLQLHHENKTNGTIHSIPGEATHADSLRVLRRFAADEPGPRDDARAATATLAGKGYRWLAVYRGFFPREGLLRLRGELGEPAAEDERVVLWWIGEGAQPPPARASSSP